MTRQATLLTATLLLATTTIMAQADRSLNYGSQGFAIPGTSAVSYGSPITLSSDALEPSFATTPMSSSSSAAADRKRAETAQHAEAPADTTHVAPDGSQTTTAMGWGYPAAPYLYDGFGGLHAGLNVSLSMSVFAQFGKHARGGAGFTQSINATYVQPLGRKAWLAVGGYANHTIWNGDQFTTGGLYGELGYQFDDHWAVYLYGRKSIVNNGSPGYGYPMDYDYYGLYDTCMMGYDVGDKLGAAVRWTPNEKFSMQLSVDKNWYPQYRTGGNRKFKYSDSQTQSTSVGNSSSRISTTK